MGRVPPALMYLERMKLAGVSVTLEDYHDRVPALMRDDLVLWEESRIVRQKAEYERMNKRGGTSMTFDRD